MPGSGTFAVPGGESAAGALSVPNYVTTGILNGPDCFRRGPSEVCYEVPGLFSGMTGPMEWCGSAGTEITTGGLVGYDESTTCGTMSQVHLSLLLHLLCACPCCCSYSIITVLNHHACKGPFVSPRSELYCLFLQQRTCGHPLLNRLATGTGSASL